ncbi:hypothetical protein AVEN_263765-1 [Araneus ventricosus]|uniref:Uncharacterized protein n=1 Tax=Araneus ventricosus TaxID=182803 RepID=A0A4Y2ASM2_ARAVE|nr:hypothetical protein AVEN_263765-1 [Araneus ventricosus]
MIFFPLANFTTCESNGRQEVQSQDYMAGGVRYSSQAPTISPGWPQIPSHRDTWTDTILVKKHPFTIAQFWQLLVNGFLQTIQLATVFNRINYLVRRNRQCPSSSTSNRV